jgi:hypothetical protein
MVNAMLKNVCPEAVQKISEARRAKNRSGAKRLPIVAYSEAIERNETYEALHAAC